MRGFEVTWIPMCAPRAPIREPRRPSPGAHHRWSRLHRHPPRERLADHTHVVLLDNFRRDSLRSVPNLRAHSNVSVISGDMLDPPSLDRALDGFDTVVHLAATAGVSSYYTESLRTLQVNILGTASLPERAADRGMERFVR